MNRLLLFLCCICVPWMARGQAAYDWYYWFDMAHTMGVTGQATGDRFTIETDARGLSEGFHAIHVQVADTAGRFSPPQTQLFYHTTDRTIKQLNYWFDNEMALSHTVFAPLNNLSIDVSSLEPGLHFIYCQLEDIAGHRSDIVCRAFYRQAVHSALKWTYWFDEDKRPRATMPFPGEVVMIDVSGLQEGLHVLHNQVFDLTASDITTTLFIKIPQTENTGDMTCICTIDGKLVAAEKVPATGGLLKWDMDVEKMDVGIHKAMFQVITPSGTASTIAERYFVRAITNKEMSGMKCVYAIDNFETYTQAGTLDNGLFHFDLDVASIENGLHRIAYMLVSEDGITTPQKTSFFWKTPLGGDGIVQYDYWVNNNDDQKHSVQLDKRTNPFNLITLLPVETQPIRTSKFQFAVKNGTPLIYARNDFHIQFFDVNGRMVEETKEYVDEQVAGTVELVGELQETQTFDKVEENNIRWYTMQAAPGDTAAFRLNQPATVQVFAPSGKEVFKTSESASVQWTGIHTWEDGTYYLAVHDVTGSKNTMTLDYMHMDKYDVVDWDVRTVGNGGCSTITFKGNGFGDLYAVDLYTADGDTIHSVGISHDSDAETAVTFDFTDATLGVYDAVFHFTDEDKRVPNVVTVEEAVDIDIATEVLYASSYLKGTKNPYRITLTNQGNMTAYNVPVIIGFSEEHDGALSYIKVDGYNLSEVYDGIWRETLSEALFDSLRNSTIKHGDMCYFIKEDSSTIDEGFRFARYTSLFPSIPPNSAAHITVSIMSSEPTIMHIWVANPDGTNSGETEVPRKTRYKYPKWQCDKFKKEHADCIKAELKDYGQETGACDIKQAIPPSCDDDPPRKSTPQPPVDPNDIYGYLSDAGSKFIADSVVKVNYTIEFENDTAFAQASAHTIVVKDTLDSRYFDLKSFLPTGMKLGGREVFLNETDVMSQNGVTTFLKTIDVRPEINAIAQIEGTYSQKTGIAEWRFTSLDPMTMEPTDDLMQGILPVNYDGTSGVGEVMFEIGVKPNKADGTQIPNRAGIVFDYEDAILTPTWINTVDGTAPVSHITDVKMATDTTATVRIEATDELSGPWRYDVYVQYGNGAQWVKAAENVPADTTANVRVYEGIDHGFYVIVTDSAGNVEQKEAAREFNLEVFAPQVDTDTKIELAQGWNWISHNQQEVLAAEALKPKAQRIVSQTDELFKDNRIGWVGTLEELLPTELYKVQMPEAAEVQLSGRLFNAAFRMVPLYEGWNWMGYPVAKVMTPAEALQNMEAEEGDFIVGQDGMVTFTDGQWTGTLQTMEPGLGYMYRSVSDKNLFLNATAQYSSRSNVKAATQQKANRYVGAGIPEDWSVDKRKYPNVMGLVADLYQNDVMADTDKWLVAAFADKECRGLSQVVNGHLMMNVYGTGGERITFLAMDRESGEVVAVDEYETFRTDILGTMQQPYMLHSDGATGIYESQFTDLQEDGTSVYDLQGRRVVNGKMSNGNLKSGVYIISDQKNKKTQKVLTK